MGIPFYKIAGSGNDFILIDNRNAIFKGDLNEKARLLCRDRFSVGANGVILIEKSGAADFGWRLFNADGSEAEMCGNGARCAARYAYLLGIVGSKMTFETGAGILSAEITAEDRARIELTTPKGMKLDTPLVIDRERAVDFINTGVPHAVVISSEPVSSFDVKALGRIIRNHPRFAPAGTNANFVEITGRHSLKIRTYERGVEDETMACGTGSVAAALISGAKGLTESPVEVTPTGGKKLTVHFTLSNNRFDDVMLEGDAVIISNGTIHEGAFQE